MSLEEGFRGKRILVTGASRGIGRAVCVRLDKLGTARIYALARTKEDLDSLEKECPSVKGIVADLLDWDGTREALKDIEPVDYLVNNSGISKIEAFLKIQPESFDRMLGINVRGMICVSQVVVEMMIQAGIQGSILNVSSVGSKKTFQMRGAYGASKTALDSLTRTMARELGPHKIRVNCKTNDSDFVSSINPAGVNTCGLTDAIQQAQDLGVGDILPGIERYPMGENMIDLEQIENSILFLLSNKMAPMITGESLLIDGGLCLT